MARKASTKARTAETGKAETEAPKTSSRPARKASPATKTSAVSEPAATRKTASRKAAPRKTVSRPAARAPSRSTRSTGRKGALETAKNSVAKVVGDARKSIPEMPSLSGALPGPVGDTVKAIGNQIVGALNSDIGRVMVAELLIYVAKSLTTAAAKTEAAEDAKSALLNVGAKIGAAAADAGSKMVENGRDVASAGMEAASGTVQDASGLAREVAQVAMGAVADTASRIMKRRGSRKTSPEVARMVANPGPNNRL